LICAEIRKYSVIFAVIYANAPKLKRARPESHPCCIHKRPPDEAVTKEVTVGPWPELSADKKKCVTSSANLNQFNFFESNDTSKPPPAASKYIDPDAAFAYLGNLELFDPAEVGTSKWPPDPGEVRTSKRHPDPGSVGTLEGPPDPGAVGTFKWTPDPGGCLGA
jgi:hypothetical protein